MAPLLDPPIRAALCARLAVTAAGDTLFHELPLSRGQRVADVLTVGESIAGYEIKSDRDSLARLPAQAEHYAKACEYMTAVVARRHLSGATAKLPAYWGLIVAEPRDHDTVMVDVRPPTFNPDTDLRTLIRMMWRVECHRALRALGCPANDRMSLLEVWAELNALPAADVVPQVKLALRGRRRIPIPRQIPKVSLHDAAGRARLPASLAKFA